MQEEVLFKLISAAPFDQKTKDFHLADDFERSGAYPTSSIS
jgi:hypothetical protein